MNSERPLFRRAVEERNNWGPYGFVEVLGRRWLIRWAALRGLADIVSAADHVAEPPLVRHHKPVAQCGSCVPNIRN